MHYSMQEDVGSFSVLTETAVVKPLLSLSLYILPLMYPRCNSELSDRSLMSAGIDRISNFLSHCTCVTVVPTLYNVIRQDEPVLAT